MTQGRYVEEYDAFDHRPDVKLLPPDREKNLQRRYGYSYHLTQIDYQEGFKFGLGVKHFKNKVLVSRVDEGSLSAKALMTGDRIVDVNGQPVSDKNVVKTMLLRSLRNTHTVSLTIERAEDPAAKAAVNTALTASEMQPPSIPLDSDVIEIMKRQKKKLETPVVPPKIGIMRKGEAKPDKRVTLNLGRTEVVITTDHEGKQFKRVGPSK